MISILIWSLVFIFSLILLIKSSDFFTDASEKIGLWLHISPFIVGVTIVAFGTSLPELISSSFAVVQGYSEIVAGNVIGSNIANTLLVLGLSVVFGGVITIKKKNFNFDLAYLIWSSILLFVFVYDGKFTFIEGILSVICLVYYVYHSTKNNKHGNDKKTKNSLKKTTFPILVISGVGIFIGAKYTINSVIFFSNLLNIGTEVISASIVALGTSLPEVTVSIIAAKKGKGEMALGNVLGSNIFNIFIVMGLSSFFGTLKITIRTLTFILPVMLISTLLFLGVCYDKKITKKEGFILILLYIIFIIKLLI